MCEPRDARRSAPAALRNRDAIAAVLREHLPKTGLMLEIASGTGEHVVHFAQAFPHLSWQPSDIDPDALASIQAWRTEMMEAGAASNLLPPIHLDMLSEISPEIRPAAVVCINMMHISPPEATEGLLRLAGALLPVDTPLVLYGPYFRPGIEPQPSNLAFDQSLRNRNATWGIRHLDWVDSRARAHQLHRTAMIEMPANNLALVYRREASRR